jgi:signal transduction histidine kinase
VRYRITHETTYVYDELVSLCHNELRLEPRETDTQRRLGTALRIEPPPTALTAELDYFGNPTHVFTVEEAHDRMVLVAQSEVLLAAPEAEPLWTPAWDALRDELDDLANNLNQMLEQIERLMMGMREVADNIAHDLRTPLASIQGYLETLLLKHGTLSSEEERSYLEVAAKHSERLGRLIRDLFQLTKLEAQELKPQREAFPVAELVQDVVQKFQLAADKRGLQLSSRLGIQHAQVHADIGMIESVLENLIENAMRHTAGGGVVEVEVVPLDKARVAVRVVDTGRGIPSDQLPGIFDRYYRVSRGEASDAGSTGLGLAITRHIVELHGGKIQVESVPARGTTFSFDLSLATDQPATPAADEARQ